MKQLGKNILIRLLCIIPFTSVSCQGLAHEVDTPQADSISGIVPDTALNVYTDSILDVTFHSDTLLKENLLQKTESVKPVSKNVVKSISIQSATASEEVSLPQEETAKSAGETRCASTEPVALVEESLQASAISVYSDSILNVLLQSDAHLNEKIQAGNVVAQSLQVDGTSSISSRFDTIPEKKNVGRHYRGVKNLLFVKKKSWMTGLTISQGRYDSEDTEVLSLLKDFDCEASYFSINPFLGYFIQDNIAVGLKFGYQKVYTNLANFNIEISDDMSLSLKDMSFNQNMFNTTLFHRSYVGIDRGKRFGLFNEVSLSYSFGSSNYQRGSGENLRNTKTDIHELRIGLNPGATVFIMENVSAELSFGVAGLNYRRQRQTTNGVDSGWRNSSGANFKINLLNINIGIVAYL